MAITVIYKSRGGYWQAAIVEAMHFELVQYPAVGTDILAMIGGPGEIGVAAEGNGSETYTVTPLGDGVVKVKMT